MVSKKKRVGNWLKVKLSESQFEWVSEWVQIEWLFIWVENWISHNLRKKIEWFAF